MDVFADALQLTRNRFWRQNEVDISGCNSAARHCTVPCRLLILSERHTTERFDGLKTQGSVRCSTRQNHSDSTALLVFCQRAQKRIYRHAPAPIRADWRKMERPVCDGHVGVWRNHIHMIRFNLHALRHLDDRHFRGLPKQFGKNAFVLRSKMLNQNKRHVGIRRQSREELFKCLESARRSSDTYDRNRASIRRAFSSDLLLRSFLLCRSGLIRFPERSCDAAPLALHDSPPNSGSVRLLFRKDRIRIAFRQKFRQKHPPNGLRLRLTPIRHFLESCRSLLVPALEREFAKPHLESGTFFQRPNRSPERRFNRFGISCADAVPRERVTDPAAEAQQPSIFHFPESSIAIRAREG